MKKISLFVLIMSFVFVGMLAQQNIGQTIDTTAQDKVIVEKEYRQTMQYYKEKLQETNKQSFYTSFFKNMTIVQLQHMLQEAKTEQGYRKFANLIEQEKETYGTITQIELIQAIEQKLAKETYGRYMPQYNGDYLGNKAMLKTEQQKEKPIAYTPIVSNIKEAHNTKQVTSKQANTKQSAKRGNK